MRILVIMNLYPPHAYGGYEDLCAGAVTFWRRAGHEVVVLTSDHVRADVPADAPPPEGEQVRRSLPLYWDDHRLLDPPLAICLRWERRAKRVLEEVVDEVRPDVASVWNPGALPFGLFRYVEEAGIPPVLVIGDRWLAWGPWSDPWLRRFHGPMRPLAPLVRRLARVSTGLPRLGEHVIGCFATEHLRTDARRNGVWSVDEAILVPHGFDSDRYPVHPGPVSAWRGRALFVGRVVYQKGVDTAIRAVADLPEVTLDVIGPGPGDVRRDLETLSQDLGVAERVRFRGGATAPELKRAYDGADVLMFPSRWEEPFGIVPLEAMARGVPVVATGTGGSGEFLVDGRTVLCFPRGDHRALAHRVGQLAADPQLRQRLRKAGTEVAGWLTRERTYADLLAWHLYAGQQGPRPAGDRPVLPPALASSQTFER